ncbi:MAG: nuclear transport factor 2 family protein [Ignavibacteria bacterium]|nr:nuclear transport factor 2 family protein [Ignavibacteria bacterium]
MFKFFLCLFVLVNITIAQDDISQIEKMRYQAMIDSDVQTLNSLLHDMLVYNHSDGTSQTKEEFIKSVAEGKLDYKKIETDNVTVIGFKTTIILSGIVQMDVVLNNQDLKIKSRFSAVYVSDKGWRLILWQTTRME